MDLLPDVFYQMRQDDFWLKLEGWIEQLLYEQSVVRRHAYIIHCSMSSKPVSIDKLWPMPNGKRLPEDTSKQKALLKKFKEREYLDKIHGTGN